MPLQGFEDAGMKAKVARSARSGMLLFAMALPAAGAASAQAVRSVATGPEITPPPAVAAPAPTGAREVVAVKIDHAKVIRLPEKTQTVVVGNPIIADITAQKNGVLVVTGKSYGVTNLIALDAGGAMLAESMISVQAPSDAVVTVQRGLERESYSCTPNCQPSLLLGDSKKHFDEVGGQTGQRNTLATGRQ
jgi:Flp pilus assembly secretin CpaC